MRSNKGYRFTTSVKTRLMLVEFGISEPSDWLQFTNVTRKVSSSSSLVLVGPSEERWRCMVQDPRFTEGNSVLQLGVLLKLLKLILFLFKMLHYIFFKSGSQIMNTLK